MTEIKRVGIGSLARFFAGLYFVIGLIGGIIAGVMMMLNKDTGTGEAILFAVLMPIIYGIIGAAFGALVGFIYNTFARRLGGIKVELSNDSE